MSDANGSVELLLAAVINDDRETVQQMLRKAPELASLSVNEARLELKVPHWIYEGDTVLHLAAAGHRPEIVRMLLDVGADPNAARNHRRSTPLHYAADGYINSELWNASRQLKTIRMLLKAGAEAGAQDKNGATPLHRAVRTRCAEAVELLLESGSDPGIPNKPGSTAFHLACKILDAVARARKSPKTPSDKLSGHFWREKFPSP